MIKPKQIENCKIKEMDCPDRALWWAVKLHLPLTALTVPSRKEVLLV